MLAIDQKKSVQQVDVKQVQQILKTNPLADGSEGDMILDNDSKFAKMTGDWKRENRGSYGPSMFIDDSKGNPYKSVQFIPSINKPGKYHVYVYLPKMANASSKTAVTIFDGGNKTERFIESGTLKVEGQTSGEWIDLGAYNFKKDRKSYVEISNKNADGVVVADAVLLVPETK